jgi:hypothetical protein
MSVNWSYTGHTNTETLISSIYCSKVINNLPPVYIWMVVLKSGIEQSVGAFKETDFTHEEDRLALRKANENILSLNEKGVDLLNNMLLRH